MKGPGQPQSKALAGEEEIVQSLLEGINTVAYPKAFVKRKLPKEARISVEEVAQAMEKAATVTGASPPAANAEATKSSLPGGRRIEDCIDAAPQACTLMHVVDSGVVCLRISCVGRTCCVFLGSHRGGRVLMVLHPLVIRVVSLWVHRGGGVRITLHALVVRVVSSWFTEEGYVFLMLHALAIRLLTQRRGVGQGAAGEIDCMKRGVFNLIFCLAFRQTEKSPCWFIYTSFYVSGLEERARYLLLHRLFLSRASSKQIEQSASTAYLVPKRIRFRRHLAFCFSSSASPVCVFSFVMTSFSQRPNEKTFLGDDDLTADILYVLFMSDHLSSLLLSGVPSHVLHLLVTLSNLCPFTIYDCCPLFFFHHSTPPPPHRTHPPRHRQSHNSAIRSQQQQQRQRPSHRVRGEGGGLAASASPSRNGILQKGEPHYRTIEGELITPTCTLPVPPEEAGCMGVRVLELSSRRSTLLQAEERSRLRGLRVGAHDPILPVFSPKRSSQL